MENLVVRARLELARPNGQRILNPSCLPIPTPDQILMDTKKDNELFTVYLSN